MLRDVGGVASVTASVLARRWRASFSARITSRLARPAVIATSSVSSSMRELLDVVLARRGDDLGADVEQAQQVQVAREEGHLVGADDQDGARGGERAETEPHLLAGELRAVSSMLE